METPDVGIVIYKKIEQTVNFYSNESVNSKVIKGNYSVSSLSNWILEHIKLNVVFIDNWLNLNLTLLLEFCYT